MPRSPWPREDPVRASLGALRAVDGVVVLAVSGGLDSMVLLEEAARVLAPARLVVATFDHGTGEHARAAVRVVRERCRVLGIRCVVGRGRGIEAREAAWREARWRFLRRVADRVGGRVVTAHTASDHLETVLMRALRGAGARGLAGLLAPSPVLRPFLALEREWLERWALASGVRWVEDPGNRSRAHLRNRVRHELLPALRRARPTLAAELLALSRRAAEWRRDVDDLVASRVRVRRLDRGASAALHVAAADLAGYDEPGLAILWPAILARAGVVLDRRGTERLAEFTMEGRVGAAIPLAGGWELSRGRDAYVLRRGARPAPPPVALPLTGVLRWGRWSFFVGAAPGGHGPRGRGGVVLPAGEPLLVRGWSPADRMRAGPGRPRRVKRLLEEAGLPPGRRAGWPVVVAGDEVLWIPGVRRADAATERSGGPGVVCYCDCDRPRAEPG
jgi:tRNA(Ile)-lysidine synthase